MYRCRLCAFILSALLTAFPCCAISERIFVDGVVASIDNTAITLRDVAKRLPVKRHISISDLSTDPIASALLEQIIMETLIEKEADARKISVAQSEIDEYIAEVAKSNNMSIGQFEKALKKEGIPFKNYKRKVKIDILRTKLASVLFREGVGVTESEVDEYLASHPELKGGKEIVKLRQIYLPDVEASAKILEEIAKKFSKGISFAKLAAIYSKSPDASEGGLIGEVALADLSPTIQDAIRSTEEGRITKPIHERGGYKIFYVEQRIKGGEEQSVREQVRKKLEDIK
ncbi:MAG: hypothetical protein D6808_02595, partial [Candidatus Dadabacteria bacterium]